MGQTFELILLCRVNYFCSVLVFAPSGGTMLTVLLEILFEANYSASHGIILINDTRTPLTPFPLIILIVKLIV